MFKKILTILVVCTLALSVVAQSLLPQDETERRVTPFVNQYTAQSPVRKAAKAGILLIGTGDTLRACNPCNQTPATALSYAAICNKYKQQLGDSVNVYCMPIPTAVEYYCPDAAKGWTHAEHPVLNAMFAALQDDVLVVNAYNILGDHYREPIFSRTDHHWAPLGAYYAAMKLCQVAQVPFVELDRYEAHTVHRYVGTMATFSGEKAVKQAPEDFVYYTPKDLQYTTTYIQYKLQNHKIVGENAPAQGQFFHHYPDGSSAAYCCFMGGDSKITQVHTAVQNHRRVLVFKDSFGNAIPGYLFGSFEEVHVVDFRFFDRNIIKYIHDHQITDVVFANNLTHACGNAAKRAYEQFLVQ